MATWPMTMTLHMLVSMTILSLSLFYCPFAFEKKQIISRNRSHRCKNARWHKPMCQVPHLHLVRECGCDINSVCFLHFWRRDHFWRKLCRYRAALLCFLAQIHRHGKFIRIEEPIVINISLRDKKSTTLVAVCWPIVDSGFTQGNHELCYALTTIWYCRTIPIPRFAAEHQHWHQYLAMDLSEKKRTPPPSQKRTPPKKNNVMLWLSLLQL